ncbi:Hypothetical predicted protein [Pelobates cultripes]|uniref:Uncharacterized protein n=1 Tax=Pelobates cultripes TaxID=61616 RepID=A0AAD1TAU3_PELCU|nr:Hypothetical predicted protein [Pelobates cultripes]
MGDPKSDFIHTSGNDIPSSDLLGTGPTPMCSGPDLNSTCRGDKPLPTEPFYSGRVHSTASRRLPPPREET